MEDLFNNREVALGIWFSAILVWALTKRDFQQSIYSLVAAALSRSLVIPVVVFIGYFFLVVLILIVIGFWKLEMLKSTIYWFVLSGLALFGKAISDSKPIENWREIVRGQISIIVILTLIVNTYTFSLYAEMILVPVVALISMLVAYAEFHHKDEPVANLFKGVQVVIGLFILFFAGISAYNDYVNLSSMDTILDLLLPVVFASMVIPYMYFMALYSAYEKIIHIATFKQTPELTSYIRKQVLFNGGLNLRKARLISTIKPYELMRANNRKEVDIVIQRHLKGEANTE